MKFFISWKFSIIIAALCLVNVVLAISVDDSVLGWVCAFFGWSVVSMERYVRE